MRQELLMPKLGLTMTEGSISEWTVAPGSVYKKGDCLFVVETEKITNEIEADEAGALVEIVVPAGETVPVGTVLGYIESEASSGQGSVPAASKASVASEPEPASEPAVESPAKAEPVVAGTSAPNQFKGERIVATPLARRIARERNVDLATVNGTGPGGRIVARDIGDGAPSQAAMPAHSPVQQAAAQQSSSDQLFTILKPTALQTTAAARLTQSVQEAPHFYLALEAEVSRLLSLRKELNASRPGQDGTRFTLNHFIVKAVAAALRSQPEANQVWADEGIKRFSQVNVGVAINTDAGLVAPTATNVGLSSLTAVAQNVNGLIARARDGKLVMDDMSPAAITVSNAGMHNVTYMGSIINPGQAMILGVGSVKQVFRPDDDGNPILKQEMGLVLSADHRVTDGVRALSFLNAIVQYLEQPLMLLAD